MRKNIVWSLVLFFVLLGVAGLAFRVQRVEASGTIFIRADGSVEGTAYIQSGDNVTYVFTADIFNDSIIVERSNIIIDGDGWTLDGFAPTIWGEGLNLTNVSNVTIIDINIEHFDVGIGLFSSTGNTVSDNWITSCSEAIELVSSSGNTISKNNMSDVSKGILSSNSMDNTISGNSVTHSSHGVLLYGSSNFNEITGNNFTGNEYAGIQLESSSNNNTISDNYMAKNDYGVRVEESSGNMISGNNITANWYSGIRLINSADNTIWKNDITNNSLSVQGKSGIELYMSSNNLLLENNIIANNWWGINPANSGNNTIFRNNVTNNNVGINSVSSDFNVVLANNIKDNVYSGVYLESSAHNKFQYNNFINNTNQVVLELGYTNNWDDGFEGNYWSNYTGVDLNRDGIGDSWLEIDENNTDHYPLMGMFSDFQATSEHHVQTISNSTISDFQFNGTAVSFNVSGENGTAGFCRICIPKALMNDTFRVFVNGTEILPSPEPLPCSNSTHSYLYFNYTHSTQEVIIIPEFPSFLILPLFMIATLLSAILYRRRLRE